MNLAGGKNKSKPSEIIDITIASSTDEDITKNLQVYTVTTPCSSAKRISKESVREYSDLKNVSDKIHLSGGAIDLLVGTDFVEAFTDIHSVQRTWRAHREKKLIWMVRSRTVRVKLLHPI